MKVCAFFVLVFFLSSNAHGEIGEKDMNLIAKGMKKAFADCFQKKSIVIDGVLNKTSDHIDKDQLQSQLNDLLKNQSAEDTMKSKLTITGQAKSGKSLSQSTYTFTLSDCPGEAILEKTVKW